MCVLLPPSPPPCPSLSLLLLLLLLLLLDESPGPKGDSGEVTSSTSPGLVVVD